MFTVFTNADGGKHDLSIDYDAKLRVQTQAGVSLFDLLEDKATPFMQLISDPDKSIACAVAILDLKGDALKAFYRGLRGDSITRLQDALGNAIVDFFQDSRRRETAAKLLQAWREFNEGLMKRAKIETDQMNPTLIAQTMVDAVEKHLTNEASGKSGDSPGTSA